MASSAKATAPKNKKKASLPVEATAKPGHLVTDDPLARLACLVRKAEAKTASTRLESQMVEADAALKAANTRLASACLRAREKAQWEKTIEQCSDEETELKELTKQLAAFRQHLSPEEADEAAQSAVKSQKQIVARREEAVATIQGIQAEIVASKANFEAAKSTYERVADDYNRLDLDIPDAFTESIEIIRTFNNSTPVGMLRNLREDFSAAERYYGSLTRQEQYHQLWVWMATLRLIQSRWSDDQDGERTLLEETYRWFVGVSKNYTPGYIEAFKHDHVADWEEAIEYHREALIRATQSLPAAPPSREHTASQIAALDD